MSVISTFWPYSKVIKRSGKSKGANQYFSMLGIRLAFQYSSLYTEFSKENFEKKANYWLVQV